MFPSTCDEVSFVVITERRRVGRGVAELWCGPSLLGLVHEEDGALVLRLESHASGLTLHAIALERALADARETLAHRDVTDPAAVRSS
jgi:hypothetical protein